MTHKLFRTVVIIFSLSTTVICATAQTGTSSDVSPPAPAQARTNADEDFELNIVERHIVEENFDASTEVAIGGDETRRVDVRVGVAAGAERIDVILRGVRGRVRFRGSLDAILRRLGIRGAETTAAAVAR